MKSSVTWRPRNNWMASGDIQIWPRSVAPLHVGTHWCWKNSAATSWALRHPCRCQSCCCSNCPCSWLKSPITNLTPPMPRMSSVVKVSKSWSLNCLARGQVGPWAYRWRWEADAPNGVWARHAHCSSAPWAKGRPKLLQGHLKALRRQSNYLPKSNFASEAQVIPQEGELLDSLLYPRSVPAQVLNVLTDNSVSANDQMPGAKSKRTSSFSLSPPGLLTPTVSTLPKWGPGLSASPYLIVPSWEDSREKRDINFGPMTCVVQTLAQEHCCKPPPTRTLGRPTSLSWGWRTGQRVCAAAEPM